MKLFCIVRPDVAVFGKKDYQQLTIIKEMVSQFGMRSALFRQNCSAIRKPDWRSLPAIVT